ncbi:uncharacterized protein LOC143341259 isoform X1 [Colletes latitarsis]|uniref:uncharacterized protein LOC143341259 isoform X1 n=1 Tax=Colletes latitarsis TaxID=2605962 RepID=UPI00403576F5
MHLSLTRCRIGDIGCDLLLGCLANNPNLRVLNLSACRLTNRSATSLSLFLNRRRADLLQNVWVESSLLSCEENSTKQTQGLHALILNQNPKFGDNGVRQLMAALNIDYWLKSLSIRHCGITKHGAEAIVKLLQSNSTLVKMDLAQNHIHINTLQVVLKLLRRRRETMESKSLKKRFIRNWKNISLKNTLRRNKIRQLVCKSSKRLCQSEERHNRRSLKSCSPKRLLRFQRNPSQPKEIRIAKKERNSVRKNISELQSQLLDIIDSNSKLREELSSNNALLDTEVQERSKTEDELQNLSFRLNEVKSRVILVNCLRSKICDESQLLQKGFRHIFEKIESFSS